MEVTSSKLLNEVGKLSFEVRLRKANIYLSLFKKHLHFLYLNISLSIK